MQNPWGFFAERIKEILESSKIGEIVFIPKYPPNLWFALAVVFILAVGSGVMVFCFGARENHFYFGLALGLLFPLALYRMYTRVRFGSSIVFERWLLPPRIVEYAEIRDIFRGTFETARGKVWLTHNVKNLPEFQSALDQCFHKGLLSISQIKGELAVKHKITAKVAPLMVLLASVLAVAANYFRPFGLDLHFLLWACISFSLAAIVGEVLSRRKFKIYLQNVGEGE